MKLSRLLLISTFIFAVNSSTYALDEELIENGIQNWKSTSPVINLKAFSADAQDTSKEENTSSQWRGLKTIDHNGHNFLLFLTLNLAPTSDSANGYLYLMPDTTPEDLSEDAYLNFYSKVPAEKSATCAYFNMRKLSEDAPSYCLVENIRTVEKWTNKGLAKVVLGELKDFIFKKTNADLMVASVQYSRTFSMKAFQSVDFTEFPYVDYKTIYECQLNGEKKTIRFFSGEAGNLRLTKDEYAESARKNAQ